MTINFANRMTCLAALVAATAGACSAGETTHSGAGGSAAGGRTGTTLGTGGAPTTGGSGGGTGTGTPLSLPLAVTTFFNNQGWFGDPTVSASFTAGSTVIQQAESAAGPCASRLATTLGQCLRVIYTPPPALAQAPAATGEFVGVFFLTTLSAAHPELTPPANVGDANWGAEPGRNIASGATSISFYAAAPNAGQVVTFKAGTDRDTFAVPEHDETLGTTWQPYTLPLVGQSYGTSVIGAFAWILKNTNVPATFYLDGIVWQ